MGKVKILIKLKVKFYNEYFTGGGKGTSVISEYMQKDILGLPYIAGTALKGKLRYWGVNIYQALSNQKCSMYYHSNKSCECMICKMFGSGDNKQGLLRFQNLSLKVADSLDSREKQIFNYRPGIQINRYMNVVSDGALRSYETASNITDSYFHGEINGYLEESEYKKQLVILYLAFQMMETLGGFQSRGLGWIDKKKMNIYINSKEITETELQLWGDKVEI